MIYNENKTYKTTKERASRSAIVSIFFAHTALPKCAANAAEFDAHALNSERAKRATA